MITEITQIMYGQHVQLTHSSCTCFFSISAAISAPDRGSCEPPVGPPQVPRTGSEGPPQGPVPIAGSSAAVTCHPNHPCRRRDVSSEAAAAPSSRVRWDNTLQARSLARAPYFATSIARHDGGPQLAVGCRCQVNRILGSPQGTPLSSLQPRQGGFNTGEQIRKSKHGIIGIQRRRYRLGGVGGAVKFALVIARSVI